MPRELTRTEALERELLRALDRCERNAMRTSTSTSKRRDVDSQAFRDVSNFKSHIDDEITRHDDDARAHVHSMELNALAIALARRDAELSAVHREMIELRGALERTSGDAEARARDVATSTMTIDALTIELDTERRVSIDTAEALERAIERASRTSEREKALEEALEVERARRRRAERDVAPARERGRKEGAIEGESKAAAMMGVIEGLEKELERVRGRLRRRDDDAAAGDAERRRKRDARDVERETLREEVRTLESERERLRASLKAAYDANASLKATCERNADRSRAEAARRVELAERVVTLERRIDDMRAQHLDAELGYKTRLEKTLEDLRSSRNEVVSESKARREAEAELERAKSALESAETRERRVAETLEHTKSARTRIEKAYYDADRR